VVVATHLLHQIRLAAGSASIRGTNGLGARSPFVVNVVVGVEELDCPPRQDVDDGVLDQRREDEHEADDHPDVDRLDVGDAR